MLGFFWLIEGFRQGRWDLRLATALLTNGILSVVASYEQVFHAFAKNYVSQRTLWRLKEDFPSLMPCLKDAARNFVYGEYHVFSRHELILALFSERCSRRSAVAPFPFSAASGEKPIIPPLRSRGSTRRGRCFSCSSAWRPRFRSGSVWRNGGQSGSGGCPCPRRRWCKFPAFTSCIPSFGISLWHTCWRFGVVPRWSQARGAIAVSIVATVFVVQAAAIVLRRDSINEWQGGHPTYRQFFAEKQFQEIAKFIGQPQDSYRVASVGMYPSIALTTASTAWTATCQTTASSTIWLFGASSCLSWSEASACEEESRAGAKRTRFNCRSTLIGAYVATYSPWNSRPKAMIGYGRKTEEARSTDSTSTALLFCNWEDDIFSLRSVFGRQTTVDCGLFTYLTEIAAQPLGRSTFMRFFQTNRPATRPTAQRQRGGRRDDAARAFLMRPHLFAIDRLQGSLEGPAAAPAMPPIPTVGLSRRSGLLPNASKGRQDAYESVVETDASKPRKAMSRKFPGASARRLCLLALMAALPLAVLLATPMFGDLRNNCTGTRSKRTSSDRSPGISIVLSSCDASAISASITGCAGPRLTWWTAARFLPSN